MSDIKSIPEVSVRKLIEDALNAGFLIENYRYKLSFGSTGYTSTLSSYSKVLDGEWVALLSASNDAHMALFSNIRALLAAHDAELAASRAEVERLRADAERYQKLLRWMGSNAPEGWEKVEELGALCAWMGLDAAQEALDSMPECNVGLCENTARAALTQTGEPK
jgi:hypothetical protein